ncbi:MAG: hypothetical protein MN733_20405 [Nitrososphaera sp.]|nr:hypothetical protein [Nitrososphaera sp.]
MTFSFRASNFEEYWTEYILATALSIRNLVQSDPERLAAIKLDAEQSARKFLGGNGVAIFPWQVLIATAVQD